MGHVGRGSPAHDHDQGNATMDTTEPGTDGVLSAEGVPLAPMRTAAPAVVDIRPERVVALRRPPRFYLTYLDAPNDGRDPGLPLGTCLVLKAIGGQTPRRVEVDLPGGTVRTARKLPRGAGLAVASPDDLAAVAELGTVFVEWTSLDGMSRTAWVRVPPVPARYRDRTVG